MHGPLNLNSTHSYQTAERKTILKVAPRGRPLLSISCTNCALTVAVWVHVRKIWLFIKNVAPPDGRRCARCIRRAGFRIGPF